MIREERQEKQVEYNNKKKYHFFADSTLRGHGDEAEELSVKLAVVWYGSSGWNCYWFFSFIYFKLTTIQTSIQCK